MCSARGVRAILGRREEGKGRTVLVAAKAFDGGVARLNDVEVERGAEEPLSHKDAAECRACDVEDAWKMVTEGA